MIKLEQTIDCACLGVDVNVEVARGRSKTGNGLDVSSKSVAVHALLVTSFKAFLAARVVE